MEGVAARGRTRNGKHMLTAGHRALFASGRTKAQCVAMVVRRNKPETQSRRGFRAEMC